MNHENTEPRLGSDFVKRANELADEALNNLEKRFIDSESAGSQMPSRELKDLVRRQHAVLERVMEPAALIGEVVTINSDQAKGTDVIVSCYGKLISVKPLPDEKLAVGDMVKLSANSSQIVGVIDRFNVGSVCIVRKVVDEVLSEVDFGGTVRMVMNGKYAGSLNADDRVVLDSSGSSIVAHLGKSGNRFQLGSKPTITWEDIFGLEDAKRLLKEIIETGIKFPNLSKHYKLKQPNGALVFGPPGCGKTMLLEAVATALASLHGSEAIDSGFINVKGPEILDMYVGNTERNVRALFMLAKKHMEKYKYPAVIVIDEAEAILSKRGSGVSSDMEKTVVPAFLAEMNGIDDSSAIVFLATNRQDLLDPAVIRDKRLDRIVKVGRPNLDGAKNIFRSRLRRYPCEGDVEELVAIAIAEFYSDKYKIYEVAKRDEDKIELIAFKLADLINGAMIAAVVDDKAVWEAFERDKLNGGEDDASKRLGITRQDIVRAVEVTYEQKYSLNHTDELGEFIADFKDKFAGAKKMKLVQAQKN